MNKIKVGTNIKNTTKHLIALVTLISFAKATTYDQNHPLYILKLGGGIITAKDSSTSGIARLDTISDIAQQHWQALSAFYYTRSPLW